MLLPISPIPTMPAFAQMRPRCLEPHPKSDLLFCLRFICHLIGRIFGPSLWLRHNGPFFKVPPAFPESD